MMNPDVKPIWTGALRSGQFKQGRGALARQTKDGIEYCCWGVLCQLAAEAGIIEPPTTAWEGDDLLKFDECTALPPYSVLAWAGLERFGTKVTVNSMVDNLAIHNDNHLADFLAIADGIEADL